MEKPPTVPPNQIQGDARMIHIGFGSGCICNHEPFLAETVGEAPTVNFINNSRSREGGGGCTKGKLERRARARKKPIQPEPERGGKLILYSVRKKRPLLKLNNRYFSISLLPDIPRRKHKNLKEERLADHKFRLGNKLLHG